MRTGYGLRRVVNCTYGLVCFGLFTVFGPHAPYCCTMVVLLLALLPSEFWSFVSKFPLIPSHVERRHAALMELSIVKRHRQRGHRTAPLRTRSMIQRSNSALLDTRRVNSLRSESIRRSNTIRLPPGVRVTAIHPIYFQFNNCCHY